MDVLFVAKQRGVLKIPFPELGARHAIVFNRGKCRTSNKAEIRKLLSDETVGRYVSLAPGQDLEKIDKYLQSEDQPDIMTAEFLDEIPFEAYREIIPLRNDLGEKIKFPLVGMAKAALTGKPMDSRIEEIKEKYLSEDAPVKEESEEEKPGKDNTEDEKSEEEEVKAEKVETKETNDAEKKVAPKKKPGIKVKKEVSDAPKIDTTTDDLNVREAVDIINDGHPYEYLRDFISEGEKRVTILNLWNDKYPDHQVELPE